MGGKPGPRDFDPVRVGNLETDAWAAYYRRDWRTFLTAAVEMVGAGFEMSRRKTLYGAWLVLRANQKWAPYPDNDPDAARDLMRRFYLLVGARQRTCASTRRHAGGRVVATAPGTPARPPGSRL